METPEAQLPPEVLPDTPTTQPESSRRGVVVGVVLGVVVILGLLITALVLLLHPNTDAEYVARIRDVFIIIMAFQSLLIGFVLVILIIQIARLTNLLQNEIKPILDSTNQTISTLRGTTTFLSDNMVEPVIRLNEIRAGLGQVLSFLGLVRNVHRNDRKGG